MFGHFMTLCMKGLTSWNFSQGASLPPFPFLLKKKSYLKNIDKGNLIKTIETLVEKLNIV